VAVRAVTPGPARSRLVAMPNDASENHAVTGSLFSRVSSAVLGNLLRGVRFLGRLFDGWAPNL
jgi:hypothetical protein